MNDLLWQRVEAALDARRDPLEDPDIAAALSCDPQSLAALQRLLGRLALLPSRLERDPGGHSLRRVSALAAGVLALVSASVLLLGERSNDAPGDVPGTALASASSATTHTLVTGVSLTVETTTLQPTRRPRVVLEPRHIVTWNLEER